MNKVQDSVHEGIWFLLLDEVASGRETLVRLAGAARDALDEVVVEVAQNGVDRSEAAQERLLPRLKHSPCLSKLSERRAFVAMGRRQCGKDERASLVGAVGERCVVGSGFGVGQLDCSSGDVSEPAAQRF